MVAKIRTGIGRLQKREPGQSRDLLRVVSGNFLCNCLPTQGYFGCEERFLQLITL